ncbi:hypothetical protein D3C83_51760 [compost metagenome]
MSWASAAADAATCCGSSPDEAVIALFRALITAARVSFSKSIAPWTAVTRLGIRS